VRYGCAIPSLHATDAAAMGFDFVELETWELHPDEDERGGFAVLKKRIERSGIPAVSFRNLLPGHRKVVGPDVDLDGLRAYLGVVVARAAELGGEVIVLGSGEARRVPPGYPEGRALEQFSTAGRIAGDIAASRGLRIAIEALNRTETNLLHFVGDAAELTRRIDHPSVGVVVDAYHMHMEHEPWRAILDAGERIFHVQVSDVGRTHPGSRSLDLWGFFTFLNAASYDRTVSIECAWARFLEDGARALAFVREASRSKGQLPFSA
jgi:D-psicose/D-tagatose/L-ribulose 3-epimerase